MSKHWLDEGWRLFLGILVTAIAGVITGHGNWYVLLFLLLYSAWMISRFHELERWLRDGGMKRKAPDTIGIASEIMQLIHRDKRFNVKQKDRLRSTLNQFNDLAAELPDATLVLGDHLDIRWCNSACKDLLGIHRRRDNGQRIDNLIREPAFHEFMQANDPQQELEIVSPLNPQITLSMRRVPTVDGLSILTGRDITQRVQLREMRKAFVADVSHELKTPLTVIHGYHELLQDDDRLPEDALKALRGAAGQSMRMSNIVNDLLTLSRLESSALGNAEGDEINVHELVTTLINDMRQTRSDEHEFVQETDTSLQIRGKENEIYSACQNLIENALKYTDVGTQIRVEWQRRNGGAVLSVIDNGSGIDPEHIPRISERFYRVDKHRSREKGGTGLGLAIVKHIAQRHGGQLLVQSKPGQGSQFHLEFPANRVVA